jgi:hypothetical protein
MKTFRFEIYIHGWTKIGLRDGQRIEHTEGGPTDEGYSYTTLILERDGDAILRSEITQARDCDGRIDFYHESIAFIHDSYQTIEHSGKVHSTRVPNWKDVEHSQRDYEAEKAGY